MQTGSRNTSGPVLKVVLISTYELGRQPFGLASPAAWLRRRGMEVVTADLSVGDLPEAAVRLADLVAFYVPMHTATRLAVPLATRIKAQNPDAHICFYGLYAPMNEAYLRSTGVHTILGGEFEAGLVSLCNRLQASGAADLPQTEPLISLDRQRFLVPDRRNLPPLSGYARLRMGNGSPKTVGYTEASRGCKHLCRHCPVVPVYQGRFRIVQQHVVLEDIRRQVASGAEHITFGDPDFFNGIGHAIPLVLELHREFPDLTYDVTIKVEHLLKHADHLPTLRETGCAIVTTAVESIDNDMLALLDKGHTRTDFIRLVRLFREHDLSLNPTFIPFTPWTTLEGYAGLLALLRDLDLIEHVAPVQLAIRLLVPEGSRLLQRPEVRTLLGPFDPEYLSYRWDHPDPRVDRLHRDITRIVTRGQAKNAVRREIFGRIWAHANTALDRPFPPFDPAVVASPATVPYLTEPWYC